jgi:hypothetical protein
MANTGPWNYILVFNNDVGTISQVKDFLESRSEVLTWYYCMTNAIFLRSRYTADSLQKMFREFTHDKGRFIILDCDTDRNGWLPRKAWQFMKNEYP